MNTLTEAEANCILNDISEIIWDDNLSDLEALDRIMIVLEKYRIRTNETERAVIGEQKQN